MRGLVPRIPIGWHSARSSRWPGHKGVYARLRRAMPGHDDGGESRARMTRLISAIFVLVVFANPTGAQPPAEFYKGKTIQLMVGFGTGGEDDLWARSISRHLGNHIPGNPNVVVQH